MKAEYLARLGRMMAQRMCGVSLKDRKHCNELLSRLGIESVKNKIQRARLRWFGHVERKDENDRLKKCTRMNVTGVVGRGEGVVLRDMKAAAAFMSLDTTPVAAKGIKEGMAQERCASRNIIGGPTHARADARHTMCVWWSRSLNAYGYGDRNSTTAEEVLQIPASLP